MPAQTAHPGQLDRRIEIQRATGAKDSAGYGQLVEDWETLYCCWAKLENPLAGNTEKIFGDLETAVTRALFTIRYRDGLTEKDRIVYNSQNYDIMNIHEIGRRAYLLLICEKRI